MFSVNDVLAKSGIPHTLYYIAGYWESIEWYDMLKVAEDGSITLGLFMPDKLTQHFTSVRGVGAFIQQIFDDPGKFIGERFLDRFLSSAPQTDLILMTKSDSGKEVLNAVEYETWGSFATRLSKLSGKPISTPNFSDEVWNSDGMKQGLGELHNVMDSLYRT